LSISSSTFIYSFIFCPPTLTRCLSSVAKCVGISSESVRWVNHINFVYFRTLGIYIYVFVYISFPLVFSLSFLSSFIYNNSKTECPYPFFFISHLHFFLFFSFQRFSRVLRWRTSSCRTHTEASLWRGGEAPSVIMRGRLFFGGASRMAWWMCLCRVCVVKSLFSYLRFSF
jgi:hypothetical protein